MKNDVSAADFLNWVLNEDEDIIDDWLDYTAEFHHDSADEYEGLEAIEYIDAIKNTHPIDLDYYVATITPHILALEQEDFFGTEGINKRFS